MKDPAPGPLAGVTVADFSRVLAGPYATMTLGDLGAEVIKVERPELGDETRHWRPPVAAGGESTYFLAVNRNKRSIAIDLSTDAGREDARELALAADVLVENFAPGTMERFGLGYAQLSQQSPRLIYASVTGFGTGAGAALPGYDFLVQAVGGLMSITGDDHPTKAGVALVDVLAGQNLIAGILAALYERQRSGQGQRVEVNLLSSLLAALVNQASAHLNASTTPRRLGNAHPSIAPYQLVRASDAPIALAVGNDGQFRALTRVIQRSTGGDDLGADPRFSSNQARVAHRVELITALEKAMSHHPAATWLPRLAEAGVPAGPVNDIPAAFALAERLELDPVVRLNDDAGQPACSVACPIGLSRTPASYRLPPPPMPAPAGPELPVKAPNASPTP